MSTGEQLEATRSYPQTPRRKSATAQLVGRTALGAASKSGEVEARSGEGEPTPAKTDGKAPPEKIVSIGSAGQDRQIGAAALMLYRERETRGSCNVMVPLPVFSALDQAIADRRAARDEVATKEQITTVAVAQWLGRNGHAAFKSLDGGAPDFAPELETEKTADKALAEEVQGMRRSDCTRLNCRIAAAVNDALKQAVLDRKTAKDALREKGAIVAVALAQWLARNKHSAFKYPPS